MQNRLWRIYEGIVDGVAVTLFSAMVTITSIAVFFRYVLNAALPWAEEADRYLFIWLSLVGASITMRRKAHIAVDVLVRYLSPRFRDGAALLSQVCVIAFLGIVFWASWPVMEVTSQSRTTATDIPMSWIYLSVPVGCVLIAIETLRLMSQTWKKRREGETA